jgi:stearoyl-CoA desaturase (delta-9 desaturase)
MRHPRPKAHCTGNAAAMLDLKKPRIRTAEHSVRKIEWLGSTPFFAIHLLAFGAVWTGVTPAAAICCAVLYVARMFFVTGAYHRYFSHKTYKTSRAFQFVLAFLAQTSAQKGALWWAAHHRHHHQYSDQPQDTHSVLQDGFWYSHVLWIFDRDNSATDYSRIPDLARYPELRFLNKFYLLPPIALGALCYFWLGASGLFFGFFFSTVLLWHGTFTINSLSHVFGKRRFSTSDDSRNSWWLAIITLGEGWHNNHHRFSSSTRQGFYWYEYDITYYLLKVLSWFGLIWKLRPVPATILEEGRKSEQRYPAGAPVLPYRTLAGEVSPV